MTQFDEIGNEKLAPEQQEQEREQDEREKMVRWMSKPQLTLEIAAQVLVGVEPLRPEHDGTRDLYLLPHAFDGENGWREASDDYTKLRNFEASAEYAEVELRDAGYTDPRSLSDWLKCAQLCGIFVPWKAWLGVGDTKRVVWWHSKVTREAVLEIARMTPPSENGPNRGKVPVEKVAIRLAQQINDLNRPKGAKPIGHKSVKNLIEARKLHEVIRNCLES
jgi:hypothetical protein